MRHAVHIAAWEDEAALRVFRNLDVNDMIEAQLVRGRPCGALELFSDWRFANTMKQASFVASAVRPGGALVPFAVFGLMPFGHAGIAMAALLACNHRHFRRELVRLLRVAGDELPGFAAQHGVWRIEARTWADHPSAHGLLRALGFHREARLDGYAAGGRVDFDQYVRLVPGRDPSSPLH